jgi:hypothetical protein
MRQKLSGGVRLLVSLLWSRGGVKDAMAQGARHRAFGVQDRGYLPAIASRSGEAGGESRSHRIVDRFYLPFTTGYCIL